MISISEEVVWKFLVVQGCSGLPVWGAELTLKHMASTADDLKSSLVNSKERVYLGASCSCLNSLQGLTCGWVWAREINDTALVSSHSEGALAKTGQGKTVLKKVQDILMQQMIQAIGEHWVSLNGRSPLWEFNMQIASTKWATSLGNVGGYILPFFQKGFFLQSHEYKGSKSTKLGWGGEEGTLNFIKVVFKIQILNFPEQESSDGRLGMSHKCTFCLSHAIQDCPTIAGFRKYNQYKAFYEENHETPFQQLYPCVFQC